MKDVYCKMCNFKSAWKDEEISDQVDKICENCGERFYIVKQVCENCKSSVNKDDKYCMACGASIDTPVFCAESFAYFFESQFEVLYGPPSLL